MRNPDLPERRNRFSSIADGGPPGLEGGGDDRAVVLADREASFGREYAPKGIRAVVDGRGALSGTTNPDYMAVPREQRARLAV